jgi:hypothetical protein
MSVFHMNRGEGQEPPGQKDPGARRGLSEKGAGWLILLTCLILLLVTIAVWTSIHTEAGKWLSLDTPAFSKPPWQWVDWLLVSLAGALLYVLVNAGTFLIQPRPRFKAFTGWYIATLVKSPILALMILIFLTGVSVEISGLTLNFQDMKSPLLLVIAFVLGFYGSVAREQLNQIVKTLFPKAYGIAEQEFRIVPAAAKVVFGKSVQLRTSPPTEVTWQAPSAGKILDGEYTAPKADEAQSGQIVQITAVPKDPNIPRAIARVTLLPFEVVGASKIAYTASERYQVAPEPQGGVAWSVSPELPGAGISDDGVYTAPDKAAAEEAKATKVKITATGAAKKDDIATLEVQLVEQK